MNIIKRWFGKKEHCDQDCKIDCLIAQKECIDYLNSKASFEARRRTAHNNVLNDIYNYVNNDIEINTDYFLRDVLIALESNEWLINKLQCKMLNEE